MEKITIKEEDKDRKVRNIYEDIKIVYEPVKVIYQYRNKNGKKQYIMYIYVGKMGEKNRSIFEKMSKLDLKDSLMMLTNEEERRIIEMYGDNRYI